MPKREWTEQTIISKIKELESKGFDIGLKNLRKAYPSLVSAGYDLFGSSSGMYRACMIDPSRMYTRKTRSLQEVKGSILSRLKEGKGMTRSEVLADDPALLSAVKRRYGTWSKGMASIGVPKEEYETERSRRTWDIQSIMREVQDRFKSGKEMNETAVFRDDPRLVWAGQRTCGSWRKTMREAGLDADRLMVTREHGYWTKDHIIQEIKRLFLEDGDISSSHCQRYHNDVISSAFRLYGSWENAVTAAGFDYDSALKKHRTYSKEELLERLRRRLDQGLPMDWTSVREAEPSVAKTTRQKFGTYKNAIEALGLDYNKVNLDRLAGKKQWTASEVLKQLRSYVSEHGNLFNLFKNDQSLNDACVNYFGSLRAAAGKAGLDYDSLISVKFRTDEQVIDELKRYVERHKTLDYIQRIDNKLHGAAVWHFGSLREASIKAGFDYESLLSRKFWTKEKIIANIVQLHELHEDLSSHTAQVRFKPLFMAAIQEKYFGSWEDAIRAAGFDYDKIRRDWYQETFMGQVFEKHVLKALRAIGRDVKYQKRFRFQHETCVPDFYDPADDSWTEAKLTAWGFGVNETIQTYLRYKDRLKIIYLKGQPRNWADDSVEFIPISDMFNDLENCNAHELVGDFRMLKKGILRPELQAKLQDFISRRSQGNKDEISRLLGSGP